MSELTVVHRRLLVLVGALLVATTVGLVLLWPSSEALPRTEPGVEEVVRAEIRVFDVIAGEMDPVTGRSGDVAVVTLRIDEGPDEGQPVTLEVFLDGYPDFRVGDKVSLARLDYGDGQVEYYITDFHRLPVLTILLGLFVGAVLLISRWHGLRALIGLGASLGIVVMFIVPAILAGQSPPLVAWVGAMAVMILTLYLTHGLNEMTTSAVVGTAAALTMTIGVGLLFVTQARITGFASDDAVFARFAVEGLDLQGLVLAGLIIASLGVLDDVTVSQASTVFALHDTDRRLGWTALFARAMKVGRDHIASVVNTLFLAYAGASLALLVLFSTSGLPVVEIINSEVMAEEIVKTVVGSLGLIAAVPFTTALAALVAVRRPADAAPMGHGHRHSPRMTSSHAGGRVTASPPSGVPPQPVTSVDAVTMSSGSDGPTVGTPPSQHPRTSADAGEQPRPSARRLDVGDDLLWPSDDADPTVTFRSWVDELAVDVEPTSPADAPDPDANDAPVDGDDEDDSTQYRER